MIPIEITQEENQKISTIIDPFIEEGIAGISIRYMVSKFTAPYWFARVEFEVGNAKGEQRTPDCKEYSEMMLHLKNILESIKNKN